MVLKNKEAFVTAGYPYQTEKHVIVPKKINKWIDKRVQNVAQL